MKSNGVLEPSEARFLGAISTSSIRNLLQRSVVNAAKRQQNKKQSSKPRSDAENVPPPDPNIYADYDDAGSKKGVVMKVEKPARDAVEAEVRVCVPRASDPDVKVVVRIRPNNAHEKEGERNVKKVAEDALCVGDRSFGFDSVFDSTANQEEIFQSVGVPVVKNALDGYNTSILSIGQTGSGKTYTMWGPPSAMVQDPSPSSHQGIVPRLFQMLFSEIQKVQERSEEKLMNYQCRCSFLEIYNEQIGDLLDPTQRNLQIRDDTKNGIYVENLSEEYVSSYEDVTQILIKGLSTRRVGATSLNSKSSRSHIVFTFIVESWCKGISSNCFSSSKTSRITLVDLAALDNSKSDDVSRQCVREGKAVKKSLSQLGYLVNILANGVQSRKSEDIPYEGSCLTQLLREPLGGNAKLSVICTISQDRKSIRETLSTLRFGQRAKLIQNDPVINEITEDDVNDLSDQIRQLKEELIRAKSSNGMSNSNFRSFGGHSVRNSLNQLRLSLNRSLLLPRMDADHEEDLNIDENDVKELHMQLDKLQSSADENSEYFDCRRHCHSLSEQISCEADFTHDFESCAEDSETEEVEMKKPQSKDLPTAMAAFETSKTVSSAIRSSLSICSRSSVLQDPPLSESPRIRNIQRKSFSASSSNFFKSDVSESLQFNQGVLQQSIKPSDQIRASLQSSKLFPGPTETLAASLHRGLQIIDSHQRNSASESSTVSFSFGHLALKSSTAHDEDTSAQTSPDKRSAEKFTSYLCISCRKIANGNPNEADNGLNVVPVTKEQHTLQTCQWQDGAEDDATTDVIKRRDELEIVCREQAAQIEQLNHLVEQYKNNKERGDANTLSLDGPKNEIVLLGEVGNNSSRTVVSQDIPHDTFETKELQEVSDCEQGGNRSFDPSEKEELLKEIGTFKSKLQSSTEASPRMSTDKLRASLLSRSIHLRKSNLGPQVNNNEELEKERQRWLETESEWILLTDELRVDIESYRRRAEKAEMELKLEKKCTEELDEVVQRAVLGHGRMVEHYAELQEKHNELVEKHRRIMVGVADVQRAFAKTGKKGHGSRAAKYIAAELSSQRAEREKEREFLKKENKSLKIQLRDTAEALHAAGEVLVRLREAEQAASASEENYKEVLQENEQLRKQLEKVKRKHKMEMITMKQYLAESRLPQSALRPLYTDDTVTNFSNNQNSHIPEDDD
uniref:Kinesin motor domain-containing protein n=1 Tax=Kalanchoe fedtschenkoi TaxID=63787 RepID=A0A7N0V3Y0_KALFE